MATMGRPTIFDAEKAKIIISAIAEGNYLEDKGQAGGIE